MPKLNLGKLEELEKVKSMKCKTKDFDEVYCEIEWRDGKKTEFEFKVEE